MFPLMGCVFEEGIKHEEGMLSSLLREGVLKNEAAFHPFQPGKP